MKVELSPEMIQALLALCDSVPLRGPESKMLVAGAQAALVEALRGSQGRGGWPPASAASDDPGGSSVGPE
jgi:hypothetical protein